MNQICQRRRSRVKTKKTIEREKAKEKQLKEIRKDLQEKIQEQLPSETTGDRIKVEVEVLDVNEKMSMKHAKGVLEALLFSASKPLTPNDIRKVLKSLTPAQIKNIVTDLKKDYEKSQKSFEIIEIAGGYEITTRKEYAPWICRIEMQKKNKQATQSALETLAILAYKQPLTRAEIEELRGVDVSGVLANLVDKGFVKIVGKKEIPGRPFIYGTTDKFLEHFGLNSLKDLPDIGEIQSLVDQSIRKEDLLGTQNIVEVSDDQNEGSDESENTEKSEIKNDETEDFDHHDVNEEDSDFAETGEVSLENNEDSVEQEENSEKSIEG